MKRILLLSLIALAAVCCQKNPSIGNSGNYAVYTQKAKNTDFSVYTTYYLADEVLVVDGNEAKPSGTPNALKLVNEVKDRMNEAGYTPAADKESADLGIQLTYAKQTKTYIGYMSNPYWWIDNYNYWPAYWGNYWGGGYTYPVTYSSSYITFSIDMVNLTASKGSTEKLPVLWSSFIGGGSGYYVYNDIAKLITAINQAFDQSPYLNK